MRIKNRSKVLTTLIILTLILSSTTAFAQSEVTIKLNGKKVNFPDAKPYMDAAAGRIIVPARFVAEGLDALVNWDPIKTEVSITKDNTKIKFKSGEKRFLLNDIEKLMDTTAFVRDNRAFVPLRVISENLNINVGWDESTNTVLLEEINSDKEFVIQGVWVGQSEKELIQKLGEPNRKDLSEYGFKWYIYNKDYNNYIQVGVKDNTVVGIYTNADNWESKKGINIGMTRVNVEKLLGKPIRVMVKSSGKYEIPKQDEKGTYVIDGSYVTIFYDIHNKNTVTSLQIIDEKVELSLEGFYGQYSEQLRDSFEKQLFDLSNSIRVRNNLTPFKWSDKAQISSRKHSEDMANKNYFDHTNLKGQKAFNRMENEGIAATLTAENIAAGTASAIEAHEGLMNSKGHRANILGECENLGTGVSYNEKSKYKYYYTQNFFIGR